MKDLFLGPFGPIVGYGLALVNVAFLLRTFATGRVTLWRPPEEVVSEGAVRVASLMNVVAIVGLWLFAAPDTLFTVATIAGVCALVMLIVFLTYRQVLVSWTVRDAHGKDFLGGITLTPSAQKLVKQGKSVQEIFKGAQYHPDRLWLQSSLAWSRTIVTFLLISLLTAGTGALTSAGFATQVALTNRRAAAVIHVADAPGSDPGNKPLRSPE